MRRVVQFGGLLVCTMACGSPPQQTGELPRPAEELPAPSFDREDRAPKGKESGEVWTPPAPNAYVAVSPQFLSFYGELEGGELDPKDVRVDNRTPQAVVISEVRIVDDPDSIYGEGAAAYFHVETTEPEPLLSPGGNVRLHVSFSRTGQQRSARLMVFTSHPGYGALAVSLTGKYFR